uniref:Serine hydroxymethyltransferase n=1 Tax=Arcella intermedia TaxID=1963864 RepID=A0A6B2L3Z7_9EUKA
MEALGSCLTNKYSEGLPGKRYYGGNEICDQVEELCIRRALDLFKLDHTQWGVNVQPYSGSVANLAALISILDPNDKILGLSLPCGGHLSHGHQTPQRKVSATSVFYNCIHYGLDENGFLNYSAIDEQIQAEKPKLIIAGASAYPRDWDYAKLRESIDKVDGFLLVDMAHYSGLVAAGEHNNPFLHADLVTTTTHKSLRGPRAGMIFYKKGLIKKRGKDYDLDVNVNNAVFPCLQGGPHMNQIAAIAVALKEANTPEFRLYAKQVIANARALAAALIAKGYDIQTGGTDNHLMLWSLKKQDLTGNKVEKVCEKAGITINKNTVVGDVSAAIPSGVRLGTPALTSRGLVEKDMEVVASFLDESVKISVKVQNLVGKKLADFLPALENNPEILQLKERVELFSKNFQMPGL